MPDHIDALRVAPAAEQVAWRAAEARAVTRKDPIDQLGLLLLAGHGTRASALTWVCQLVATRPALVARLRRQIADVFRDGPVTFEHTRRLPIIRNALRETLRLYPPITFLPRTAYRATSLDGDRVTRGAAAMVAPWVLHRDQRYWRSPHVFYTDRVTAEREGEMTSGACMPFGIGPRPCAGTAFAPAEAVLLVARLVRRFDLHAAEPGELRPAARLTTRPVDQVMATVSAAP